MSSPSNAVFVGGINHPLAVDLELGEVKDDAGGRNLVEGLPYKALLKSGLGCCRWHDELLSQANHVLLSPVSILFC